MGRPTRFTRPITAAVTFMLLLLLAGCGGSDEPAGGGSGPATVRLGVIPIVDVAPVYLGQEKGFFEKRDITLKLSSGVGGAAIVPGVVSGDLDIGFGNNVSTIQAVSKDLPMQIVASGVYSTGKQGEDYIAVVVPEDSPIETAADLEGRTVAINTLENLGDLTMRASVQKAGGDPSKVKFLELDFPEMNAALRSGRVDAIWQVEPFLTIAKNQGNRVVASPIVDVGEGTLVSTYFTTEQYAESNEDVVRRFKEAVDESLTYAQEHPDEVRGVLHQYTEIPPEVASEITLPRWDPAISEESLTRLAEFAERYGLIEQRVSPDELLQ